MAGLSSKVKAYAAANGVADVDFSNDVKLQDNSDGKGAFIAEWNLAISKPTDAQLADVEADADTAEANATVLDKAVSMLKDIPDGIVWAIFADAQSADWDLEIQTRMSKKSNRPLHQSLQFLSGYH